MNKDNLNKKIVLGCAVIALFGTLTNYVYFSPLLTLLIPLCLFAVHEKALPRPIFWLYVFGGMFLLSTLLYDWHSVFAFKYYRRDGNFVIAYAPLFILPLFSFKYNLKRIVRYFYLFVLIIYSVLFLNYLVHINLLNAVAENVFRGLFYAQNAVGGYLAVLAGLGFAYVYNRVGLKECFYFALMFLMLIATYSRGSILGFLLGLAAWYCTITYRMKTLVAIVTVPVLLTAGALMIGYPSYHQSISVHHEVNRSFQDETAKSANVLARVFNLWPQAFYLFTKSPIVGTGVGSYDDRPLQVKKIMPLVAYNAQPHKVHTDRHAHHSYLMILAEQGIVGLGLFLTFWISMFFYLRRIRGAPVLRDFLLIAYFTLTFAAFTEHRITTPSNMLPFTIIAGLFIANKKTANTYIIEEIRR